MEKIIDKKPLGVIDALSAGFEMVLRHPWVLLIPIALDLFLWLGPQIRAKPVFDQIIGTLGSTPVQGAPVDTQQTIDALRGALQSAGDEFNVFSFIALFGLGLPTLLSGYIPSGDWTRPATLFAVQDPATLLGWLLVFGLTGILLGSIYLEAIARMVRNETGLRALALELLKAYANILVLVIVVVIGAGLLAIPFVFGALIVSLLNQGLGSFFLLAGWLIILWMALYLAFAVPAIFVSGANVPQAILNSIAVFRYNFWPAMGLIFLIVLLQTGFSVIWEGLLNTFWGVLVGTVANAILGTALIAAGMLFYHDRFTWLTHVRERIHQHRPSLKG